jgi:hypothetical protein
VRAVGGRCAREARKRTVRARGEKEESDLELAPDDEDAVDDEDGRVLLSSMRT